MAEENGGGRIDRIEGALASLTSSVASLTDVTKLISDNLLRVAEAQSETRKRMKKLRGLE